MVGIVDLEVSERNTYVLSGMSLCATAPTGNGAGPESTADVGAPRIALTPPANRPRETD